MTQGERIREVRKTLGLTLEKFGEKIGMKKNSVSQIENGKNSVTEQVVKSICREFNVDYIWLTTGDGEMFVEKTKDEQIAEMLADIQLSDEDSFKHRLASALAAFTEDDWNDLERLLNKLSGKSQPPA